MQFFKKQQKEPAKRFKVSAWPSSHSCLQGPGEHLCAGQMPLTLTATGEAPAQSSFELCEFIRRKKTCPYFCENKYTKKVTEIFCWWWVCYCCYILVFFYLISKQLLHHIKKAPLKLTAKKELARALYIWLVLYEKCSYSAQSQNKKIIFHKFTENKLAQQFQCHCCRLVNNDSWVFWNRLSISCVTF